MSEKFSVQNLIRNYLLIFFFTDNIKDYQTRYQLLINEQLSSPKTLMPSIISSNSKFLYAKPSDISSRIQWLNDKNLQLINDSNNDNITRLMSRFSLNERLNTDKLIKNKNNKLEELINKNKNDDVGGKKEQEEKDKKKLTEEEEKKTAVELLKGECDTLRAEYEEIVEEIKKLEIKSVEEQAKFEEKEREFEKFKEEHKVKNKIYELLEDGDNNIKKLEEAIEADKNKLINLAEQWEKHRAPLIKEYRDERDKFYAQAVSIF